MRDKLAIVLISCAVAFGVGHAVGGCVPAGYEVIQSISLSPVLQSAALTSGTASGTVTETRSYYGNYTFGAQFSSACAPQDAVYWVCDVSAYVAAAWQFGASTDYVYSSLEDPVTHEVRVVAAVPVGLLMPINRWDGSLDSLAPILDALELCLWDAEMWDCDTLPCGLGTTWYPYASEDYYSVTAGNNYLGWAVNNLYWGGKCIEIVVNGYCEGVGTVPVYYAYFTVAWGTDSAQLVRVGECRSAHWYALFECADAYTQGARPGVDAGDVPTEPDDGGTSEPDSGTPGYSDGDGEPDNGNGEPDNGNSEPNPNLPGGPTLPDTGGGGAPDAPGSGDDGLPPPPPGTPGDSDGDGEPDLPPAEVPGSEGIPQAPDTEQIPGIPGSPPVPGIPEPDPQVPAPVTPHPCWDASEGEPCTYYLAPTEYTPNPDLGERSVWSTDSACYYGSAYFSNGEVVHAGMSREELTEAIGRMRQQVEAGHKVYHIRIPSGGEGMAYQVVEQRIGVAVAAYDGKTAVVEQTEDGWTDPAKIEASRPELQFGGRRALPALYEVVELDEQTVRKLLLEGEAGYISDSRYLARDMVGSLTEAEGDRGTRPREIRGAVVVGLPHASSEYQLDVATSTVQDQVSWVDRSLTYLRERIESITDVATAGMNQAFAIEPCADCPEIVYPQYDGQQVTWASSTEWCEALNRMRASIRWAIGMGMLGILASFISRRLEVVRSVLFGRGEGGEG